MFQECPICPKVREMLKQLSAFGSATVYFTVRVPDKVNGDKDVEIYNLASLRVHCRECGGKGHVLTDEGRKLADLLGIKPPEHKEIPF